LTKLIGKSSPGAISSHTLQCDPFEKTLTTIAQVIDKDPHHHCSGDRWSNAPSVFKPYRFQENEIDDFSSVPQRQPSGALALSRRRYLRTSALSDSWLESGFGLRRIKVLW